mmetsp:Transcript_38849/g.102418  ORF Transcript_38849/g.102418 Transcript_38849/m.102418 type:complete len:81 (-) Transcript_38849:1699-1941(-)
MFITKSPYSSRLHLIFLSECTLHRMSCCHVKHPIGMSCVLDTLQPTLAHSMQVVGFMQNGCTSSTAVMRTKSEARYQSQR